MKDSRGFTLAELLVGMLLVSIIIVGAVSVFVYQNRYGSDAWVKRNARESITLAVGLLRNDILHAGYGLMWQPEMAFYPANLTNNPKKAGDRYYTKLYVNYGRYLKIASPEDSGNTVFNWSAYVEGNDFISSAVTIVRPSGTDATGSFATQFDADSIKAFICFDPSTNTLKAPVENVTCNKTDGKCSVTGGTSLGATELYAPAVVYDYDSSHSQLTRNGEAILGDNLNLFVQSFQIRFEFYNSTDPTNPLVSPTSTKTYFDSEFPFENLRLVEITIECEVKAPTNQSATGTMMTYREYVAPRAILIAKN